MILHSLKMSKAHLTARPNSFLDNARPSLAIYIAIPCIGCHIFTIYFLYISRLRNYIGMSKGLDCSPLQVRIHTKIGEEKTLKLCPFFLWSRRSLTNDRNTWHKLEYYHSLKIYGNKWSYINSIVVFVSSGSKKIIIFF